MHEFSYFLLKNWLPLGIASIFFFLVGLVFARLIWGRHTARLSFAVEENLNLASQWSALGASQRDLFKKLRVRWQDDREAWEAKLAKTEEQILKRDARISQLTQQLRGEGQTVPVELEVDDGLRKEVAALRAELKTREARIEELQNEIRENEESALVSGLPIAEDTAPSRAEESLEAGEEPDNLKLRIRELEQDLIDTHDELHDVRNGYQQQAELVESLETKLINREKKGTAESVGSSAPVASGEEAGNGRHHIQLAALLGRRGEEIRGFRGEIAALGRENARLEEAVRKAENHDAFESRIAELEERLADREGELTHTRGELTRSESEVARLVGELEHSSAEIAQLKEDLDEARDLDRRRHSLQAELNDACHEMYDVRTALNHRLEEIELLEARLDELEAVEEEKEALEERLRETRKALSELQISHDENNAELKKRDAQMEELEVIIDDRTVEVDELSTELRQKRDQIRVLKDTLAEKEGELEALAFESRTFTEKLSAKTIFLEDQSRRVADLEKALSNRYAELNEIRSKHDEEAKAARYHAARADQVEAELERRIGEFEVSDRKIADAEQALDQARAEIEQLSHRLEESEDAVGELQEQLRAVSREKDDTLRDLEQATRRIEELERAATSREERIAAVEEEWNRGIEQSRDLERELERLNGALQRSEQERDGAREEQSKLAAELEASQEEGRRLGRRIADFERDMEKLRTEVEEAHQRREEAQTSVEHLEARLHSSDQRVLELSGQIEEQEAQLSHSRERADEIESAFAEKDAELARLREEAEEIRSQLQRKLDARIRDRETLQAKQEGGASEYDAEIDQLRRTLAERENVARRLYEQQRESVAEIEKLRYRVDKRGEAIRGLQNEVSNIMLQRADRDNEIGLLKDKLRAVEAELESARRATEAGSGTSASGASAIEDLETALKNSISEELTDEQSGTSLDELPEQDGHHSPAAGRGESESRPPQSAAAASVPEDEPVVFFEEGSAVLSPEARGRVDRLARSIRKAGRRVSVSVVGFAGAEGAPDHTESLSARRADAVRERLLEKGVSHSMLSVKGAGQDRRFSDGRARRVDLILVPEAVPETIN